LFHQLKRFGKSFTNFKTKFNVGSLFEAHFRTDDKNIQTLKTQ